MADSNIALDLLLKRYRAIYCDWVSVCTSMSQQPLGGPVCEDMRAVRSVIENRLLEVAFRLYQVSDDPEEVSENLLKIASEIGS